MSLLERKVLGTLRQAKENTEKIEQDESVIFNHFFRQKAYKDSYASRAAYIKSLCISISTL
jgi:hypothetical protein